MICVTIARHSRRFALAGIWYAARMSADLGDVRLDTIEHEPDLAEMIAAKRTPLIVRCFSYRTARHDGPRQEERLQFLWCCAGRPIRTVQRYQMR